ncbi:MAG: cytochrome c [Nitrospirae bacterium]|nr:MAG: cytochrome c [Nitrospirota bacterium]
MKRWVIVAAILVIGAWLLGMWLLPGAFSAKRKPTELEIAMARFLRHWATPVDYRHAVNPIPLSPEVLREARHHFADHCAICHANDGSGKTAMGPNFYPPVPDLRQDAIQSMSDGELFYVIHFGIAFTGMPAWGSSSPEKDLESWKLVHFIRHLPQITQEELDDMKRYNPISRQELEEQLAIERFLAGEDIQLPTEHGHSH